MDYTQTHSVNLPTADCNKIVKDNLNYNLAGITKTETEPNTFEYLDISATAGSLFHPRKPQKLTIKLDPIDDNVTNVTIKTEPRRPVSDYEYNDWNKELIQLGNTVWQNFLTAARNKLGELALAIKNIEPIDEPKNREEHAEQPTKSATVLQSEQQTSPELQPIQNNADIAVSTTAQAENTKINPKTWWIIGGVVAAIIIFIILVSGGGKTIPSKFYGTYYNPQYGKVIISKDSVVLSFSGGSSTVESDKFTVENNTLSYTDADVFIKYFDDADCVCLYTSNSGMRILNSDMLSVAQKRNGNFYYEDRKFDTDYSVILRIYKTDGSYLFYSKSTDIIMGRYTYENGLLRTYAGNTYVQQYLSEDGYLYTDAFAKR